MTTSDNKTVINHFVEQVINQGNLAVLDEVLTSSYVYHAPGLEVSGPEGMQVVFTMLRRAFPDWHETVEDLIAEGDRVVFRVTGRGTHQGEFYGIPPTGKRVSMSGIDIVRLDGQRIAEHWAIFDQFGLMQQLGVIPAPESPG
jgi:steroid delta-isomerase-like uncharacterized protein